MNIKDGGILGTLVGSSLEKSDNNSDNSSSMPQTREQNSDWSIKAAACLIQDNKVVIVALKPLVYGF